MQTTKTAAVPNEDKPPVEWPNTDIGMDITENTVVPANISVQHRLAQNPQALNGLEQGQINADGTFGLSDGTELASAAYVKFISQMYLYDRKEFLKWATADEYLFALRLHNYPELEQLLERFRGYIDYAWIGRENDTTAAAA